MRSTGCRLPPRPPDAGNAIAYGVTPLLGLSDAVTVFGVTVAHLIGLVALAGSVTD